MTQTAYTRLRTGTITCELAPGSEMSEMELAGRLGMSKTPIREALGRLDLEGFVETCPRRGYRVSPITMKDINDLFAVRRVLEHTAAALAAQNLTDAEFDQLEQMASASYTRDEARSLTQFVESNRLFHITIAQGSHTPACATW
jgi:DNA-binding GntR family transcriptional regulator